MGSCFSRIEVSEVNNTLKWLRNGKAPGPDGVWNEMIKLFRTRKRDFRYELAEILAVLFNRIIDTGKFPTRWKQCSIVPAYKKGNTSEIGNFRPICLLSGISKVFTRLINAKVSKAAENFHVVSNTQEGGGK